MRPLRTPLGPIGAPLRLKIGLRKVTMIHQEMTWGRSEVTWAIREATWGLEM